MVRQMAIPTQTRAAKSRYAQEDVLEAARLLLSQAAGKENTVNLDAAPFTDVKQGGKIVKSGKTQAQTAAWYVRQAVAQVLHVSPKEYLGSRTWENPDSTSDYAVYLKKTLPDGTKLPAQIAAPKEPTKRPAKRS